LKYFIKNFLKSYKGLREFKKLNSVSRKIVFYAEDMQSQNYLIDLLKELLVNFDEEVCYLTSDPEDSIFKLNASYKKLNIFYIGDGFFRTWLFATIETDLMIMTMPDIETFHLKRSKVYDVHYLYIFHAMVSTHSNYRLGAFDSYDTIFCTGKQQMLEIRKTEEFYDLKKKNLYMDGYRPLEYLLDESHGYMKTTSKKIMILIAPSWGANNIFELCIEKLLDSLLKSEVEIILRPHPMTIRHSFDHLKKLKEQYHEKENLLIQTDITNRDPLFNSDVLITDWSGIGMEYGLGLLKPVIYIDTPKKNNNPEFNKINLKPIEVQIRSEIGSIVEMNDLDNINSHINDVIRSYDPNHIIKIREKYVFMKENSIYKSARRVLSIANSNRSRNKKN
jgi:YidC/Oxa1 family membrane protein insertase